MTIDKDAESVEQVKTERRVKKTQGIQEGTAIVADSSKPTTQERRRKKQKQDTGPLGFVKPDDLPGYQLRWILVDHPDKPHRYFAICEEDDYSPVSYEELGAARGTIFRDAHGNPLTGNVVVANKGTGVNMLVKKPIEFYEADLKEKTKRNLQRIEQLLPKSGDGVTFTKSSITIS